MEHKQGVKSYKISSSELETMLTADFGGKLQPVNHTKLKFQQVQRQRLAALRKSKHHSGETPDTELLEPE